MTSHILTELLKLTNLSKTEYAIALNYSPSAISKFLSGDKFTNPEIARKFIDNSAELFTNLIYEKKLRSQLENLFPLILEMEDRNETYKFLQMAIEFSIIKNSDFPNLNYFHGTKSTIKSDTETINYLLIFLSDLMTRYDKDINLYVNFSLSYLIETDWIRKLKFNKAAFKHKVIVHQLLSPKDDLQKVSMLEFLNYYDNALDSFEYRLHYTDDPIPFQGILIPSETILLFSFLPSNQLISTHINDSIAVMMNSRELNKIFKHESYFNEIDFMSFLETLSGEDIISICKGISSVYTFLPLNFMVEMEDLEKVQLDPVSKSKLVSLFNGLTMGKKHFIISKNAAENFIKTKKYLIPGVGEIEIDSHRLPVMYKKYSNIVADGNSSIGFSLGKNKNISAVIYGDYIIIFSRKNDHNDEKSIILKLGKDLLEKMIMNDIDQNNYFYLTKDDYFTIVNLV